MKIYVPEDNIYNKCYVIQNESTIRAYNVVPRNNITYQYRDYYIKSDYIFKDGSGTWGNTTNLPVCLSSDVITDNFYYRYDFTNILINIFVVSIFCIYVPFQVFKCLFKGLR